MSELSAWLLGLAVLGYFISKWFSDRTYRNNMAEFNNKVLNSQISERDKAIADLTKKQKEEVDAYYEKSAKYLIDHKRGVADPSKGND